jgi:hypothetical protein
MAQRKTRFDRRRFNIGTYCIAEYAREDRHVREMKECGIDFLTAAPYDKKLLDNCEKYGIGVVATGVIPGWWGGDGQNAGKFESAVPLEKVKEAADRYVDHPAVRGIDVGDEPSALDYAHYGRLISYAETLFPNKLIYLNLYPNYASVAENTDNQVNSQLGTATYQEYIDKYVALVNTDYICLDNYEFAAGELKLYDNLRIVANACRDSKRDFWIVLQVNSNNPDVWLTTDNLRHQAFSSMAFGAVSINWACWTAGWWHNQVLDKEGEKTEQYDKLKTVNMEIRKLEPVYMAYKNISAHFAGKTTDAVAGSGVLCVPVWANEIFANVKPSDGETLAVGYMNKREGRGHALFLADVTDRNGGDKNRSVSFMVNPGYKVKAYHSGEEFELKYENGVYETEITPCGAVMITAEKE